MKQNIFQHYKITIRCICLFFSMCVLFSCTNSIEENDLGQKSRVLVNIHPFSITEEFATRSEISVAATRLSFAVYDAKGILVGTITHQASSSESFGTIAMELYPGTYTMVAVAHNGEADATISSTTSVTLPGTRFTDTFSGVQSLTVEMGKDCTLGMTLPRVTSAFILRLLDTPPADAKEIKVVVNSGGLEPTALEINPTTGLAANNWKQTCTIPVSKISTDVPIYFIGMYNSSTVTIKATAYDTEDKEIISHTISGVTMIPNRKTIATGTFFKSSGTGSFTLNDSWGDDNEINY